MLLCHILLPKSFNVSVKLLTETLFYFKKALRNNVLPLINIINIHQQDLVTHQIPNQLLYTKQP